MPFLEPIWDAFLVHPLMALATLAYGIAHDFGLAIVILTVCIRLAVYPLYRTQIRSQRAMQELGPAMEELKKKYGKDKARFAEEQMKLYKERGVNPAAGCVPLLLQLPLLFALYSAIVQLGCGLGHSIGASCLAPLTHDEASQILLSFLPNPIPEGGSLDTAAHWLPWLNGLHERDPLYILPIIAGLAQLVASVMAMPTKQPVNADPNTKMSSTPLFRVASLALSRNAGVVSRKRARESTSCLASSSAVYSGLAVVLTPPSDATARKMLAYSGTFGL